MTQHNIQSIVLLCLLVLAPSTGCSLGNGDHWKFAKVWDVRRAIGMKKDEPAAPQVPTRLVSTWTDTILHRQGEKAQRGFGGRLLFFNEEAEDPVRVEGQLVVYAFDESGRAAHETQPTRRFVFPREQFVLHESEAKVGASYSVWLPWDEVGGEQKNISLIARFEPKAGPLVVGEQTKHLLPGVRHLASGGTAPATEPISDIRLTEYTQKSQVTLPASKPSPPQSVRPPVTSIALAGKNWEQRLRAPQNKPPSRTASTIAAERATVYPGPE
jgi:hypothetical protein